MRTPMKHFLLCCLVVSLTTTAHAQWIHQNPVPTSETMRDIAWPSASTMLTVGDAANIHRSSDGGVTWKLLHGGEAGSWGTGLTTPFLAMHALNDEVMLAVNYLGAIVRTVNGGDTWSVVYNQLYQYMYSIAFLDERDGIVGGHNGVTLRTIDGGRSWSVRPRITGVGHLYAVAMRTPADWVVTTSEGAIFRTADSGTTWVQSSITPMKPLYGIHFADAQHGVAVGTDGAAVTTDGGATWRYQEDVVTTELRDVAHTSAGWVAVGRTGFIMRSDDGTSWRRVQSGTTQDLVAISFRDGLNGVALGISGTLLHTTDGGLSFTVLRDTPIPQLRAVSFSDPLHGVAAGLGGAILQTDNGGATWRSLTTSITTDLVAAAWASPTTGIVAGRRALHHTTDGGATWTQRLSSDSTFACATIRGARALAVTTSGEAYASADTGRTWQSVDCGHPAVLTAASILDDDTWVLAGPRAVLFTDDAGASWVAKAGFTSHQLLDMQFIDGRTGWILERGSLHRTTNGGVTFERLAVTSTATRLHFTDALRGVMIVGKATWHSTDGGFTWSNSSVLTPAALWDVDFTDAGHGWVVGDNGVILTTGSILPPVSVEAPAALVAGWTLEAWPQPARGVLNVALRGDLRETVTLRLVDMLGREVGGVIERAPGASFAVFDVRTLPPGAYVLIASTPGATRMHRILTY